MFGETSVSVKQYFLFSSLALIIIFAWLEPAGAAGIGFWKGLFFWSIQISILIPLLIATQQFAFLYVKPLNSSATWIQTTLSGIVAALLYVPIGYTLDHLFAIPDNDSPAGLVFSLLDEAAGVVVPVVITWLGLNAPWILQLDFSRNKLEVIPGCDENERETNTGDTTNPSKFLQELRSRASGSLISLSSELHYIRATTTEAEVMFLYNLRDAIKDLPSNLGIQIHRSHWVAKDHIKELVKKNGNALCILSNGKNLPISRKNYSAVKSFVSSHPDNFQKSTSTTLEVVYCDTSKGKSKTI